MCRITVSHLTTELHMDYTVQLSRHSAFLSRSQLHARPDNGTCLIFEQSCPRRRPHSASTRPRCTPNPTLELWYLFPLTRPFASPSSPSFAPSTHCSATTSRSSCLPPAPEAPLPQPSRPLPALLCVSPLPLPRPPPRRSSLGPHFLPTLLASFICTCKRASLWGRSRRLEKLFDRSSVPLLINSCEFDSAFPCEAQAAADDILGSGKYTPGYEQMYWEVELFLSHGDSNPVIHPVLGL